MNSVFEEISKDVTGFIQKMPLFQPWPECRHLLMGMLATNEPWIHALPILTCRAVGGEQSNVFPVAAAWMTLVHAANLIDDIQDSNFRRLAQFESPQLAMSIAVAWIFAAFRMLDDPSIDLETRDRVTTLFSSAGFDASMGQSRDLILDAGKSNSDDPLQAYWSAVILKSGSICMAGAAAGAAVGTSSTVLVEALGDYGTALGVIRQVIDDCRDIWIDAQLPDKQLTLPALLHALVANKSSRKRVKLKNKAKLSSAQIQSRGSKKLIQAGIPEIITDILLEWRWRALESLSVLDQSEARRALEDILEHVLTPKLYGLGL